MLGTNRTLSARFVKHIFGDKEEWRGKILKSLHNEELSSYLILPAALGPGVYTASNRNEDQKHKNNVSGE
jgi:hypothetical protein